MYVVYTGDVNRYIQWPNKCSIIRLEFLYLIRKCESKYNGIYSMRSFFIAFYYFLFTHLDLSFIRFFLVFLLLPAW